MFKKEKPRALITETVTDWAKVGAFIFWAVVILGILGAIAGG